MPETDYSDRGIDQGDTAELETRRYTDAALSRARQPHDYVILHGSEQVNFTGTSSQRLAFLEEIGVDTEHGTNWAAGFYDHGQRRWKVCGPDELLQDVILTMPAPERR